MQSPFIFRLANKTSRTEYEDLISKQNPTVIEKFDHLVFELFKVRHPEKKDIPGAFETFKQAYTGGKEISLQGVWVYFPWKNSVIHIVDEPEYLEILRSRNFPLISQAEASRLWSLSISIAGMSVGSSVAITLAHSAIGSHFILADPDTLELSNLNRVQASMFDLYQKKTTIAARKMYEVNPFVHIKTFDQGVTKENFRHFFEESDVIFDECDDLILKFYLRIAARSLRKPFLMVSDIGYTTESTILNFDKNIHAGKMTELPFVDFDDVVKGFESVEELVLNDEQKILLICELLGIENITDEMKTAIEFKLDKKLASFPQLGAIAFIGGGLSVLSLLTLFKESAHPNESSQINILDILSPPDAQVKSVRKKHSIQFAKKIAELLNASLLTH